MKDKEIFEKICDGDEKMLDYLYKKCYRMMTRMIIKNNGNPTEAKDVYQEALIIFWEKAVTGNLTLSTKITTYIYSICKNLWWKELERKKRTPSDDINLSEIENKYDFSQKIQDNEEKVKTQKYLLITKHLNKLGDKCNKILKYYYFDGLNMEKISKKIGYSNANSVKTKKYKCMKELEEHIKLDLSNKKP